MMLYCVKKKGSPADREDFSGKKIILVVVFNIIITITTIVIIVVVQLF